MVSLIFHGAAREVGRSCIEVKSAAGTYLLDCGVKFVPQGFVYPQGVFESETPIDGVFLSHAHLDHSGALPFLEHLGYDCPIFCTPQTMALTRILLRDSYRIAHVRHLHPAWGKTDISNVRANTKRIQPDKWYGYNGIKFIFVNAGHIPGSCSIILETDGKRILYTGDCNTRTTQLMVPADYGAVVEAHGPIDCLITEATYGNRELPQRVGLEDEFVAAVEAIVRSGGSVLIPVFAVGRAQEVLIILARKRWGCRIYFDGMVKDVTRSILLHQSVYVANKDTLNDMFMNKVVPVSSDERRSRAAQERPAIYIATSGMLDGGPAHSYLRHLWHDERSAVFLTGYQAHGTPGRELLEQRMLTVDGIKTQARCQVRKFDFSGHADVEGLKRLITALAPRTLIVNHGDPESVEALVAWASPTIRTFGPVAGDEIDIG